LNEVFTKIIIKLLTLVASCDGLAIKEIEKTHTHTDKIEKTTTLENESIPIVGER
jgi:hypothetical protein